MSLAERIQARLDELNLTPITAATKAGLPRDTIRNIFRGDSSPRADTLQKIAHALDATVSELLDEDAPPVSALAARIQERLAATGKTARSASLEAGLSADAVRTILSGRSRSPRAENFAALARVLGVDASWLLDGDRAADEPRPSAAASTTLDARPDGKVRLKFDRTVSPGVAAKILALLEEDARA